MGDDNGVGCVVAIVAALIFVAALIASGFGYEMGCRKGKLEAMRDAVKAGVAYYEVDAKTGESVFVYGANK